MRNKTTLSFLFVMLINLCSCIDDISDDEVNDELTRARAAYIEEDYGTKMKIWRELSEQEVPEALVGIGVLYNKLGFGIK